jgi:hypothetical protein
MGHSTSRDDTRFDVVTPLTPSFPPSLPPSLPSLPFLIQTNEWKQAQGKTYANDATPPPSLPLSPPSLGPSSLTHPVGKTWTSRGSLPRAWATPVGCYCCWGLHQCRGWDDGPGRLTPEAPLRWGGGGRRRRGGGRGGGDGDDSVVVGWPAWLWGLCKERREGGREGGRGGEWYA